MYLSKGHIDYLVSLANLDTAQADQAGTALWAVNYEAENEHTLDDRTPPRYTFDPKIVERFPNLSPSVQLRIVREYVKHSIRAVTWSSSPVPEIIRGIMSKMDEGLTMDAEYANDPPELY